MKVQNGWLQEYLSKSLPTKKMAGALEQSGAEIEQILYSKKLDKNIKVGLVKKVVQHPNADRLKLADVAAGKRIYKVVCGGPNLETGQKVALALPGSTLPGGLKIERSTIRGQESEGMICSPQELGLGEDHSGILVLDGSLPVGKSLCDIWPNDDILDVTTPANRPDLHSVIGLAREVASQTGGEVVWPKMAGERSGKEELSVKIKDVVRTPRYVVEKYTIDNSKPSPGWLQSRLIGSGVRPINLVVDITNFVMLETGQPLHAFDAAKIKPPISVRRAKPGEKLTTLDGVERKLTVEDLVIADARGPVALAGVMGGLSSQITPDTKQIIVESATFDGSSIRHSAVRHNLRTEASSRFERRLPVQLAPLALARAGQLLMDLAGGKPVSAVSDHLHVWPWVQRVGARSSRLTQLFGAKLSQKTIADNLRGLGFEAEPFDIVKEAKKHLGKPYVWGARFRTHGEAAFDCGYLIDFLFSRIGRIVGHTSLGIFTEGKPVHTGELRPGDILFTVGSIPEDKLVQDHYYVLDPVTHKHVRKEVKPRRKVGHSGIYVGGGKVVHASPRDGSVVEVSAETFTKAPDYVGAVRHFDDLGDHIAVTVPWWRPDVRIEEDILEEVAKIEGYGSLPATLPPWHPNKVTFDRRNPRIWQIKDALKALGLFEVNTYSFVSAEQLDQFGHDRSGHLKLKNPLSVEQAYLRSDLLPSLVTAAVQNQRHSDEFGIFEVSRVFIKRASGELPEEPTMLGLVWRAKQAAYTGAKVALDRLGQELALEFHVKEANNLGLAPHSGSVRLGSKAIGRIGTVNPLILRQLKLSGEISFLELNLDNILTQISPRQYQPVSKYPAITRDISLLVPEKLVWAQIKEVVEASEPSALSYQGEWHGEGLETGHKSVTIRLEMAAFDRTLTDEEADQRVSKVLQALERKLKIRPRD